MSVNWGQLNQPGAFERAFDSGFQLAEYGRQRREQTDQRNALSAYAMNPSDEAFNALAQHLPEVAMQQRASRDQAANEARLQDLRGRFASGDQQAGQELARVAPSEYTSLSSNRRAYEGEMVSAASNVAQRILTLPPEQRASVYEQQMAGLSQRFPELAGQAYSDELMHETIAEAGQWQQFNESQQPDFKTVPYEADLVDVRNPEALRQFAINRGAPQASAPAPQSMGGGVPSGSPLSQPAPQQAQPQQQSPIFPAGEWQTYTRAMGQALPAIVERDRPVILNSQGAQVQTDVINGQIAYRVNGVWYDNPEGQ